MTKTYTITLQINNRSHGDILEFWIPQTKELFVITLDKVVFVSRTPSPTKKSAWTELVLNISSPGKGKGVLTHTFLVPPMFLEMHRVILGCRRVVVRSQRATDEVNFTASQLSSHDLPRTIKLGATIEMCIMSSNLNIVTKQTDVLPSPGREIGIFYNLEDGCIITDEWLHGTYLDVICALGRTSKKVSDDVDEEGDFQELLMVACSETLTRGVYVEKDDVGLQTFLNGLSPCIMSREDCAIGIYQIYMSIYFGERFSMRGSQRMQHVAHELGYPMLTEDFSQFIFRRHRDQRDLVFNIPFDLSGHFLAHFHVFPVRELITSHLEDDVEAQTEETLAKRGRDMKKMVYCYARTLLKLEEHDTFLYTYSFPLLEGKHNSIIDCNQLCFVRPIIPLEYRTKNENDVHLIHLLSHYPLNRAADRYDSRHPTKFVPRLTPELKKELESKDFAFVWFYGRGFCVNTSEEEENGSEDEY